MLAILYIAVCAVFGISFVNMCVPDTARFFTACSPSKNVVSKLPPVLFIAPAGIITGMLCVSMFNYYAIYLLNLVVDGTDMARRAGVLLTFAVFIILTSVNFSAYVKRIHKAKLSGADNEDSKIPSYVHSMGNVLYYGIVTVALTGIATFLMLYTFNLSDGILRAGYSTFSDLSPHTAMVSSFSEGFNFPTQYMHFSGDGIQYHFFFYFMAGMLEYLGFSIDLALNVPSIITMVCALELLGVLAVLLSRKKPAFVLAPLFVLFRSSFNVFYHISELRKGGIPLKAALQSIAQSSTWYEQTPYDGWGIWAINVYPNQRHLMLGVGAMLILIILMTPFVRRMCVSIIKSRDAAGAPAEANWAKAFIASREAWIFRDSDPLNPWGITVLACIIAATLPFFHGSALIGALLVLLIMALFSETRVIYAAIAAVSVLSAFIQTKIFAGNASNVVSFKRMAGFVCENKTATGISNYLVMVTGLTLIVASIYVIYILVRNIMGKKPVYRELMFLAFLAPMIFAFNFQVSLEMLANHKFIQFSLILIDVFVASGIAELMAPPAKIKEKLPKAGYVAVRTGLIILAAVLIVPLTATGISEWCTYYNLNKGYVEVNTESDLTAWIVENTEPDDVFLTPQWSMNRFFLAGRPAYYGWPYYAWSAGHDTYTREQVYYWLISGCNNDIDAFRSYCASRGITYLIDDPEFFGFDYPSGALYNKEFFAEYLTPVAYFPEEATTIYRIN